MGTGYTRNDTADNIADGNIINASDLDGEFDALQSAFDNSTGHTHDGTAGEGAPIEKVGPNQEVVVTATVLRPAANNTIDLGVETTNEFKNLYIDGTAYLDSVDIDGGTIDGLSVLTVDNLSLNGNTITSTDTDGNLNLRANGDGIISVDATDVNFGDSDKATFGDGSDLQIYHDGSNSYIRENSTGDLLIQASNIQLEDPDGNNYLRGVDGGILQLYHNGTEVMQTASTGISVTGDVDASDDLILSSDGSKITFGADGDVELGHIHNFGLTLKTTGTGDNAFPEFVLQSNEDTITSGEIIGRIDFDTNSTAGGVAAGAQARINVDATDTYSSTVAGSRMEFWTTQTDGSLDLSLWLDDEQNARLGDDKKLILGDGQDFQIYHDGSNSYISDQGTGNLRILAEDFRVVNAANSETMIQANVDGDVRLYHNNSPKLATTDTGIEVNSTQAGAKILLESTDAGAADGPVLDLYRNSASPAVGDDLGLVYFSGENSTDAKVQYGVIEAFIQDPTSGAEDGFVNYTYMSSGSKVSAIQTRGDTGGAAGEVVINQGGLDMNFRVESDTDTNAMRILGTNGNVGLGLSDPEDTLHIVGRVRIDSSTPLLRFQEDDTTDENFDVGVSAGEFVVRTNNDNFDSSTTRFKITQDGDVRIGDLLSSDFGGVLNVSSNGNDTQLALVSTDEDASAGPDLKLLRSSASPADGDSTGRIRFVATDSNDNEIMIARISTGILDVTDTSEDGKLEIETTINGASRSRLLLNDTSSIFNNSGQDLDFVVESSNKTAALYVQGNTGRLGLGTNAPTAPLHVKDDTVGAMLLLENNLQSSEDDHAPELTFFRNLDNPADGDAGGAIEFNFNASTGTEKTFARIKSVANDVTNGTEDGAIFFEVRNDGTLIEQMRIDQGGVGIGGVTAETGIDLQVQGTVKISKTNNDSALILESTDGDADDGPVLLLDRASGSPADNDNLAQTIYRGRNSADEETDYVIARAEARTVTDGGEDGRYVMSVMKDGTLVNVFDVDMDGDSNEIVFNESGAHIDFRVEGSTSGSLIRTRASTDTVMLDTSATITAGPTLACHQGASNITAEFFRESSTGTATIVNMYSNVGGSNTLQHHFEANGDLEIQGTLTESSDQRIKQDIVDSGSQWDDIKAVQVRKYRKIWDVSEYGDDADVYLGVVAQELESSGMGGLVKTRVNEENPDDDLKSVRYSVLYMKAVKALQEAMARIETLETKVAALEAE